MKKSLLTVDVGNTATSFGLFDLPSSGRRPRPKKVWTVSTPDLHKPTLKIPFKNVSGAIISSVVPSVDGALSLQIRKSLGMSPIFVTGKRSGRVKIRYRNPSEVGADRIVNARAAMALRKGPAVVVDFGTATTFDCVTARGEYLGGVIAPGPVISAEALFQKTAKLPMVLLMNPAKILGRTTLESIQSGLYHGYRGLVKEIATELKKKMGAGTRVLSTGGQAHWILKGLGIIDENIPHLTLMGLYYLWHDLNSK